MKKLFLLILFCFSFSAFASDIQTKPLSKETRSVVKKYFPAVSKKIVFYNPDLLASRNPEALAFFDELEKIMRPQQVEKLYTLKKQPDTPKRYEDIDAYSAFKKDCGHICIVNMGNNWIYKICPGNQKPNIPDIMDSMDALAYQ